MFSELCHHLSGLGISLLRPDGHVNKAVADGAVSFYLDHFVSARVTKMSYGSKIRERYNPNKPGHLERQKFIVLNSGGHECIPDVYSEILPKVWKLFTLGDRIQAYDIYGSPGNTDIRKSGIPESFSSQLLFATSIVQSKGIHTMLSGGQSEPSVGR